MAMRNFLSNKMYQMHAQPVLLTSNITIGASGAVGTVNGACVKAVTKLATGIYQVQLQDNYSNLFFASASIQAPETGSNVNDGSFSTGTLYEITAVGTTDWAGAGLPSNLTPAIGQAFVATGAGGSGSGTAKAIGSSGLSHIEIAGDTQSMLAPVPSQGNGGYLILQCLQAQVPSATTQGTPIQYATANPAQGSVIYLHMHLSNSSIVVQGE